MRQRPPGNQDPRRPAKQPGRPPGPDDKPHWARGGSRNADRTKPRRRDRDGDGPVVLYGWHTVKAALQNPARRFRRLVATENAAQRLAAEGVAMPLAPEMVRPDVIAARLGPDAVHQGLYAEADPLETPDVTEIATDGPVLVLDQLTDPHNVGAILRSAAAFAVSAVITTARHSPEATGVLAKAASGALEVVPLVTVPNLARGLTTLKERDFTVIGLDGDAPLDLAAAPLRAPVALVLGAEGKGLRHLTRETCDLLARLDLPGRLKSLNVSNAAAVALHVTTMRLRRS